MRYAGGTTRGAGGVLALLLVGSTALGCGAAESEEPAPSTKEQYCDAYRDFFRARAAHGTDVSDAEVVATLKGWGEDLAEIGAPDDMSAAARGGHEKWVELISQVEDDASQADVVALESGLSPKQVGQVQEFFSYNDGECLRSGS